MGHGDPLLSGRKLELPGEPGERRATPKWAADLAYLDERPKRTVDGRIIVRWVLTVT
jgi:hypothetical protein